MMRKMDMLWIGAKTRIHNFWEDFKTEEKGAAEIVAIILIIVVVIGAAVIFKEKIIQRRNLQNRDRESFRSREDHCLYS